jgi:pimeloyl-ACP methyl ester carboxylesterase
MVAGAKATIGVAACRRPMEKSMSLTYTALSAILLAATAFVPAAIAQDAPQKTVVLVHGAWANGSSWSKVIPILESAGLRVIAVHNPLSSMAADVANTKRVIDDQPGSVILVGHSYGGAVITEAGNNDKVEALVYVAAFAPESGQSINAIIQPFGTPEYFPSIHADAGHFSTWPADAMLKWFAPDVPANEVALMAATQAPFFLGIFEETVTTAAWATKPSWFVVSADDQIIPAPLQTHFAEMMKATVVSVASSHVPMVSRPDAVAQAILSAAGL